MLSSHAQGATAVAMQQLIGLCGGIPIFIGGVICTAVANPVGTAANQLTPVFVRTFVTTLWNDVKLDLRAALQAYGTAAIDGFMSNGVVTNVQTSYHNFQSRSEQVICSHALSLRPLLARLLAPFRFSLASSLAPSPTHARSHSRSHYIAHTLTHQLTCSHHR